MKPGTDYDVIVVGAGHNALVAAAYLARGGQRVAIFERRSIVGGAVATEEVVPGYQFDLGGSAHILIRLTPIVEELEREAVRQTQVMYDSLMLGRDPRAVEAETEGPLTLTAGFELATSVPDGLYVVETEHVKEMRRAARDIVRAIGTGPGGMLRTWDGLTYSVVRELWLRLARRFNETGKGGPAWTERCVVILLQVAQWLAVAERIDRAAGVFADLVVAYDNEGPADPYAEVTPFEQMLGGSG